MERVIEITNRERVIAATKATAKTVAITISFAAIYYGLCMLNPTLAQSNIVGIFGKSFKVANLLRAFVLWNPWTAVGCFLGSQAFDYSTARMFTPFDLLGWLQVGAGFGIYRLAKTWGRKWWKDITLLALYGVASTIIQSVNVAAVAVMFLGAKGTVVSIFEEIVLFKLFTKVLLFVGGYPLLLLLGKPKTEDIGD